MNIHHHNLVQPSPGQARLANLRIKSDFDRINTAMNIVQAAANTLAGKCLYDACEVLAGHKLWNSPRIRGYANLAKRKYYGYEKLHTSNFGDRHQTFIDYLDAVEDIVDPHLRILYFAIKRVLDKRGQSDTGLKAKVELAYIMIELSCRVFDGIIREAERNRARDFTKFFKPARLTGCLSFWRNVVESVCVTRDGEPHVDLDADADIRLALDVIRVKLSDADTLNRAGYEALKLNPDIVGKYCEDDFKHLEGQYGT